VTPGLLFVYEGPVYEGPVYEGPVYEGPVYRCTIHYHTAYRCYIGPRVRKPPLTSRAQQIRTVKTHSQNAQHTTI
jgi:hypothetical protein